MREMGLSGVRRGRHYKVTTTSDDTLHRPSDLAIGALKMAIHSRNAQGLSELVHHSDRGVQYLSIRYSERLGEAGVVASVGSRGDSYDCELNRAAA